MKKTTFYALIAIGGGLVCALLRLWQLRTGFDSQSGLPLSDNLPGFLLPLLLVTLAGGGFAINFSLRGNRRNVEAFALGSVTLSLVVAGGFVMAAAGVFALYQVLSGGAEGQLLPGFAMLAAGLCGTLAAGALRNKSAGLFLLVLVCANLLVLVLFYLQTASDPVLIHYYPSTLALTLLSLCALTLSGYLYGNGRDCFYPPLAALAVVLCAAAATSLTLPLSLYLVGGGLLHLGFLLAWRAQ